MRKLPAIILQLEECSFCDGLGGYYDDGRNHEGHVVYSSQWYTCWECIGTGQQLSHDWDKELPKNWFEDKVLMEKNILEEYEELKNKFFRLWERNQVSIRGDMKDKAIKFVEEDLNLEYANDYLMAAFAGQHYVRFRFRDGIDALAFKLKFYES